MRQRVAIARTLAVKPQIILMDEPFGALDVQTRLGMQNLINELWEEIEGTILFVTHDIAEAVYLADKIHILSAGPGTIVDEIEVDLPAPPHRGPQARPPASVSSRAWCSSKIRERRRAATSASPPEAKVHATEEPNYLADAFKSQYNLIGLGTAVGFAHPLGQRSAPAARGRRGAGGAAPRGGQRALPAPGARALARGGRRRSSRRGSSKPRRCCGSCPRTSGSATAGSRCSPRRSAQNYKGLDTSSQMLLDELVQKLDFLLSFYLRMRYSLTRYEGYLATTDPERIQDRIADARARDRQRGRSASSRSRRAPRWCC